MKAPHRTAPTDHDRVTPIAPVAAGLVAAGLLAAAAACGPRTPPAPPEETVTVPRGGRVVIYVEAPRRNAGPILKSFTEQSDVEVEAIYRETLGAAFLPRLKAEAAAGKVDLFWGTSPLAAIDLARAGLAVPFRPAGARPVPGQFRDPQYRWIGFAVNPRVILYNTGRLTREEAPASIADLTGARWSGTGAVARIESGTPAFHAAALFSLWGPDRARRFFDALRTGGARIVEDDAAVRRLVASGEALWGVLDLDEAICANREAEPVHILFPDRLSLGAVVSPYVAVLLRGAPHPAQAKGLYAYLFASETAWQLGMNDCALLTLIPDIPRPDWVPVLGMLNVARLDNEAVFDAFGDNAPFFESWGAGAPAAAAPAGRSSPAASPSAAPRPSSSPPRSPKP